MGPIGSKRYVDVVCYDFALDGGDGEKKPRAVLSLRVVDGPDTGVNLTFYGYLSEAAAPYTIKALKALGWEGTKLSKAMAEGLGTRKAQAQLKIEEYNGKVTEKVAGIFEIKARGPRVANPVDDANLDQFDAMFEDLAAGIEVSAASEINKAPPLPAAVKRSAAPVKPAAEPEAF